MEVLMNLRPLFWMMVGAVATLVGGAWGGKQFLPIPGEIHQTVSLKNAIKPNSDYAAENSLRRTPWVQPKADPFGEKPKAVPRTVAPSVVNREPPPLVFPFEYVGKLIADGKETLYLSKGGQIYPVAEGEMLESLYRVEHIGSGSLELSYIPDARKMTITLDSITAKPASGAAIMPPGGWTGSIAPPSPNNFGREGVTQPGADPLPLEADMMQSIANSPSLPENEVLQQNNSAPPLTVAEEVGKQSAASSVSPMPLPPPGMFLPGMLPPGMTPLGMTPPGMPQ